MTCEHTMQATNRFDLFECCGGCKPMEPERDDLDATCKNSTTMRRMTSNVEP